MSWKSRQSTIKDSAGPSRPFIQLVNDGNALEPRSQNGGFAMPVEQSEVAGFVPAGMAPRTLVFRDNDPVPVYFGDYLEVAPLVTRFAWIKDGHRIATYIEGARGKLQVLCYVKDDQGAWQGPVMLTATGLGSKDIGAAVKSHRERVYKATRGQAPYCYFGMLLHAGESQLGGGGKQKSKVTPVLLEADFDPDRDFVGDTVADEIEVLWEPEFKPWSEAWKNNPGPNGDGEMPGSDEEDEGYSAHTGAPAPSRTPAPAPKRTSAPAPNRTSAPAPAPKRTPAPAAASTPPPSAPAPTPNTRRYPAKVPFASKKYNTVQEIFDAQDTAALEALLGWCEGKGQTDTPAYTQARYALDALRPPVPELPEFPEEELPF